MACLQILQSIATLREPEGGAAPGCSPAQSRRGSSWTQTAGSGCLQTCRPCRPRAWPPARASARARRRPPPRARPRAPPPGAPDRSARKPDVSTATPHRLIRRLPHARLRASAWRARQVSSDPDLHRLLPCATHACAQPCAYPHALQAPCMRASRPAAIKITRSTSLSGTSHLHQRSHSANGHSKHVCCLVCCPCL